MKMENLNHYRAKQYYNTKEVSLYPREAPEGEAYKVYHDNIRAVCPEEAGEFSVLELGCGTGRFFFYLCNVSQLTAVDISEHMLRAAQENLRRKPELHSVTDFVHSSIEEFETDRKFDFIYSIGTLGEYCEFNRAVLEKIITFLKPNGMFFFTIVDADAYVNREKIGIGKRAFRFAIRFLPYRLRIRLGARSQVVADWKNLFMTKKQLEEVLSSSGTPIRWEVSRSKDNLHVHHIGKVWLADAILDISPYIEYFIVI